MGALRPPNPPTAERGGAVFWCLALAIIGINKKGRGVPWHKPKIRGGAFPARGVWGAKRPHKYLVNSIKEAYINTYGNQFCKNARAW